MSAIPGTEDDLAAIHDAFAEDVFYTGAGLHGDTVRAVVNDVSEPGFEKKSFEIRYAALPDEPEKDDTIEDGDGCEWRVIDVDRRDDVEAWDIIVESAESV